MPEEIGKEIKKEAFLERQVETEEIKAFLFQMACVYTYVHAFRGIHVHIHACIHVYMCTYI